ncbi:MAG: hypothetical protein SOR40_00680 [Rothia sp. (in: high G+C Gram-positive bacteria)]|nr:hypothetical protein [Rothia sp. (in: high G+C Gram-positive bacteria)]
MSTPPHPHLPPAVEALAQITQWHTRASALPLDLRFTTNQGQPQAIHTTVTGSPSSPAPQAFTWAVTCALKELAQAGQLAGSASYRMSSTPTGSIIIKRIPSSQIQEQDQQAKAPQPSVTHEGLALRTALASYGHQKGHSPLEIAREEQERGFHFPPELRFFRSLVRQGVIGFWQGEEVLASDPQADFGVSALNSLPWQPPQSQDPAVQPLLTHPRWVEIGHTSSYLFALDFAPGQEGQLGQVIARPLGQATAPQLLAPSLLAFIGGKKAQEQADSAPQDSPLGPQASEAADQQVLAWAGDLEPCQLPPLLGWEQTPGLADYKQALSYLAAGGQAGLASDQEGAGARPLTQSTPLLSAPAGQEQGQQEAPKKPVFLASETPATPTASPGDEPEEAGAGVQVDSATDSLPTPLGDSDLLPPADSQTLLNPSATPLTSPEQRKIAQAMEVLAFGSKEERIRQADADADPVPSIAARAKKVHLTSSPAVNSPDEDNSPRQQTTSPLRASLRKFFIGN